MDGLLGWVIGGGAEAHMLHKRDGLQVTPWMTLERPQTTFNSVHEYHQ
jgi:hypothetical protein